MGHPIIRIPHRVPPGRTRKARKLSSHLYIPLLPTDKRKIIEYVERLPDGKQYTVEIKLKRKQRSVDQNRLYWMWLKCIMDETGEHKDRLHELFKQRLLGVDEQWALGRYKILIPRSTTALDTAEMTLTIDRFRDWAATEAGIYLPAPDEERLIQLAELEMERCKEYM